MGLEDLVPDDAGVPKHKSGCPDCGEDGEDRGLYDMRCTNDDCDVFTYIRTDFEVEING